MLWPMLIYFIAVSTLAASMLIISYLLGEHHREKATGQPYESGILVTGSARTPFNVKYYLVAMFFVIFDVETIFIFAWAAAFREVLWEGYFAILIFIVILSAALIYLWRSGALDCGTRRSKK